jgi:hypothetical protein
LGFGVLAALELPEGPDLSTLETLVDAAARHI